jgi:peptidoglycan/xylan/chitin deacetylase (PgdA/CDA1 family)
VRRRRLVFRLLILAVSTGYWALLALSGAVRRLLGRGAPRCVVLYYHAVRPADRANFAWQMEELARLARPVRVGASEIPVNGHRLYAMVTFDDGFRSVAENALPELARRGIPAALFVPAGSLGASPPWLAGSHHPDAGERVLAAEELRALPADLVEVGSHSLDHVRLPRLGDSEIRRQLVESRERLESVLGRPVTLFSAPHGDCDERLLGLAQQAGYTRVFTITPTSEWRGAGGISCGRLLARPDDWRLEFRLKLLGGYSWLPAASLLSCRLRSWFCRKKG